MIAALRRTGISRRARPFAPIAAVALCAVSLGGCGSISDKMSGTIADMPGVGLPANAPERPSEAKAYPAVHDMPPPRTSALLSGREQRDLEDELVSARRQQKIAADPPPPPAPAKPAARKKPAPQPAAAAMPVSAPVSSSRMIY